LYGRGWQGAAIQEARRTVMIVIIEHGQRRRTMVMFPEMPVLEWGVPVCEVLLMHVERRQRAADDQGYRRNQCEEMSDHTAPHREIMVERLQGVNKQFRERPPRRRAARLGTTSSFPKDFAVDLGGIVSLS
jgi:hypothetical protein